MFVYRNFIVTIVKESLKSIHIVTVYTPFFRKITYRSDSSTDFDARWLKRRVFTHECAFWGLKMFDINNEPPLMVKYWQKVDRF